MTESNRKKVLVFCPQEKDVGDWNYKIGDISRGIPDGTHGWIPTDRAFSVDGYTALHEAVKQSGIIIEFKDNGVEMFYIVTTPTISIPGDISALSQADNHSHSVADFSSSPFQSSVNVSGFPAVGKRSVNNEMRESFLTAELDISCWFEEGGFQAQIDDANHSKSECPFEVGTLRRKWWTRGYAYNARLFRAIEAESKNDH